MKKILILFIGIAAFSLFSCEKGADRSTYIESRYSNQEINFFYEACFNDSENNNTLLRKWDKNIYYSLSGDTVKGDKKIVLDIAKEINNLDLPIKVYPAGKQSKANLSIVSGDPGKLKLDWGTGGKAYHYRSNGIIDSASLLISKFVGREKRE